MLCIQGQPSAFLESGYSFQDKLCVLDKAKHNFIVWTTA